MKILSLGVGNMLLPVDGLPMYMMYFNEYCSKLGHELLHINLVPSEVKEDDGKVEVKDLLNGSRVINVYSPFLFYNEYSDVYKYIKAVDIYRRVLDDFKPDIIFTHDWEFIPVIMMFERKVPVVYFLHLFYMGLADTIGFSLSPLMVNSEVMGLNDIADIIICNSKSELNDLVSMFPDIEKKSVYSIHLGVDKEKYSYSPNIDSKVILYLGRLVNQKGIEYMVKDFSENEDKIRELGLELWVAGHGDYFPRIAEMHFDGRLRYMNVLNGEGKITVMKRAKYMIFPSEYEPYGLSLNEGMAMGKICIATNVGGHVEQVKDGRNGYLVDNFRLFEKIIELESEKSNDELLGISVNAREDANDISEHFKNLWEVLNRVL